MVSELTSSMKRLGFEIGHNQFEHQLVKLFDLVCLNEVELKLCMINFMKLDWIHFPQIFGMAEN